jgi:hypothetical protein
MESNFVAVPKKTGYLSLPRFEFKDVPGYCATHRETPKIALDRVFQREQKPQPLW